MDAWLRTLFAMVALGASPIALAADRLTPSSLGQPEAFRSVPLHEVLGVEPAPELALMVDVPAVWRGRAFAADTRGTRFWSTAGDFGLMRNRKRLSGRWGALVAERSFVSWDPQRGTFEDEAGDDEKRVAEKLESERPSKLRVQRIDRAGLPLLLVEADLTAQLRLRAIYVALGRNARVMRYVPQRPWSDADDLVWSRLRDSVAGMTAATP